MGIAGTKGQVRTAVFASPGEAHRGWQAWGDHPAAVHIAHTHQEVLEVIRLAEEASLQGRWVAMMLAYEAAAAFEPAMQTHALSDFPLAWAAVFDQPGALPVAEPRQ